MTFDYDKIATTIDQEYTFRTRLIRAELLCKYSRECGVPIPTTLTPLEAWLISTLRKYLGCLPNSWAECSEQQKAMMLTADQIITTVSE
jgi:hypothetical protein